MPFEASVFAVPSVLKDDVGLLSNLKISIEDKPNQNVEFFSSPATYVLHILLSRQNSVSSLGIC